MFATPVRKDPAHATLLYTSPGLAGDLVSLEFCEQQVREVFDYLAPDGAAFADLDTAP